MNNPDVLVESLATQVAVECFELVLGRVHGGGATGAGAPVPDERRATMSSALDGLRSSIELVRGTQPYEFESDAVAENLQDLVAMVEWLSEADDAVLTALEGRGVSWDGTAVDMGLFRDARRARTTTRPPSSRGWCATWIERSSIYPRPSGV